MSNTQLHPSEVKAKEENIPSDTEYASDLKINIKKLELQRVVLTKLIDMNNQTDANSIDNSNNKP
jgi:hypothetical protein